MWALFCGFPTLTFVYKGCPHELQVNWWCGIVWVCASKLLHDIFQKYTLFIGASQDPNGPSVVKNPCCSITPSQALSPFVLKLVEVSSWNAMADVSAMNQAAAWLQRRRSTKWEKNDSHGRIGSQSLVWGCSGWKRFSPEVHKRWRA